MLSKAKKRVNTVDARIGERIRSRRDFLGITRDVLASSLGVTCQQVQKYESGINRIVASRLLAASQTLKIPVQYFFDGLTEYSELGEGDGTRYISEPPPSFEIRDLIQYYLNIQDMETRQKVLGIVKTLSRENSSSPLEIKPLPNR